jgi:hypothetical protein
MPGITIKNIPDELYRCLVETVRTHHGSLAKRSWSPWSATWEHRRRTRTRCWKGFGP